MDCVITTGSGRPPLTGSRHLSAQRRLNTNRDPSQTSKLSNGPLRSANTTSVRATTSSSGGPEPSRFAPPVLLARFAHSGAYSSGGTSPSIHTREAAANAPNNNRPMTIAPTATNIFTVPTPVSRSPSALFRRKFVRAQVNGPRALSFRLAVEGLFVWLLADFRSCGAIFSPAGRIAGVEVMSEDFLEPLYRATPSVTSNLRK